MGELSVLCASAVSLERHPQGRIFSGLFVSFVVRNPSRPLPAPDWEVRLLLGTGLAGRDAGESEVQPCGLSTL